MMMNNLQNCLSGIECNEEGFLLLKKNLQNRYSVSLLTDILSLPCIRYMPKFKLMLLLSALEDKEISDEYIKLLCDLLCNISEKLWQENHIRFKTLIEEGYNLFQHNHLLLLANTIEIMYAKKYKCTYELASSIYQRIPMIDYEFNPDSDMNVRIRLAKLAYSTNKYNIGEKISEIESIKEHLKKSHRKYMYSVLNYYKGLCLSAANAQFELNNAEYYISKARKRGFPLAAVYLSHIEINSETSN